LTEVPGYRIFETRQFQSDLERIAKSGRADMEEKLREQVYPQLRERPHFGPHMRKLKDWEPETWRYRVGWWRLFYEIDEKKKAVLLTAADHRSGAYG
jgi:mRNA interferase RelE/StbE